MYGSSLSIKCFILRNLCYAIGQFCRFFGMGHRCKAALSTIPGFKPFLFEVPIQSSLSVGDPFPHDIRVIQKVN